MLSRIARPFALLALLAAAACADRGLTGHTALVPTGGAAGAELGTLLEADVLQRTTPLARDYTASAVIGKAGGTIAIPEAGFRIDFPQNAVRGQPVTITVTALAGGGAAYLFEPHGLVFHNNPTITQDLRQTEVAGYPLLRDLLEGAYFPDATYLAGTTARIKEIRPTVVDVNGWKMRFTVEHFSGYAATSRKGGYLGSSGDRVRIPRSQF